MGNQACRRGIQQIRRVLDLSDQRGNPGLTGSLPGPVQRLPGFVRLQATNGNPRLHQFMGCPQGRRQRAGVEFGQ
ncbi:hypothetical protein D9M71_832800 [compost metagenome]